MGKSDSDSDSENNPTFNPADKFGKFDLDKDNVDKWMDLARQTIHLNWLQEYPDKYLHKILDASKEKIKKIKTSGQITFIPNEENLLTHSCIELKDSENVMNNYIDAMDQVKSSKTKKEDYHPLDKVVQNNVDKGSSRSMKIMGYVTYAGQNWRDYVYLKKNSKCGHKYLCECKKLLLEKRKIDRPFLETPIREHQRIAGRLVTPNAADQETLIRVGLMASTLISADSTTSPPIPM